jgi:TetR/AcrR family transcriptional regulator, repressor of fatR-cypB operon
MKTVTKREEILQAALELIAEHGFHGAPMAMIAERAGVGAGTIYRYFETKDALISQLFDELERKILAAIKEDYPADRSFREKFFHFWTRLLRYMIAHPLHFQYMEQYHNSPYGAALHRDRILDKSNGPDLFWNLFEEAIAQRVMKDLPLLVLFSLAFGPLLILTRDHILGFIEMDDALIATTVEACWDALKR